MQSTAEQKWAFDELPENIKTWLRSESVDGVIEDLNKRFGLLGDNQRIIPFMTTWLILRYINPNETVSTLMGEFGLGPEAAQSVASAIKDRILYPIRSGLKSELGIDVERVTEYSPAQGMAASEMKMERSTGQTVNLKGAQSRGEQTQQSAPRMAAPPAPKPQEPKPNQDSSDQPFHLSEQVPQTPEQQNQPPNS